MAYTTIDNPELYFQTKLYTGTGSSNAITLDGSEDMQPDWVWIKCRDDSHNHQVFDSVRGVHKRMRTDTAGEETESSESLKSFDSDGFTVGTQANVNASASGDNSFVAWNWKAGGSASSNSDGDITSSVSVNTTAGFSVVGYTGNGTAGQTIGHGLGVAPNVIITKSRTTSNRYWGMYHSSLGNTGSFALNDTQAFDTSATYWNNTTPSSSLFTVGTNGDTNTSGTMIAYCFAEKKGYSKFGTYEGNGVASGGGPFIYLGFRPAWFLLKENGSDAWTLMDNKRLGYNKLNHHLFPDNSNVEYASDRIELRSNGVKVIDNDGSINQDGQTYIYMAFAESPFVNSNGIPNNAR